MDTGDKFGRDRAARLAGALIALALAVLSALPARAEALRLGHQSWLSW
jgi:hypothetical protein